MVMGFIRLGGFDVFSKCLGHLPTRRLLLKDGTRGELTWCKKLTEVILRGVWLRSVGFMAICPLDFEISCTHGNFGLMTVLGEMSRATRNFRIELDPTLKFSNRFSKINCLCGNENYLPYSMKKIFMQNVIQANRYWNISETKSTIANDTYKTLTTQNVMGFHKSKAYCFATHHGLMLMCNCTTVEPIEAPITLMVAVFSTSRCCM